MESKNNRKNKKNKKEVVMIAVLLVILLCLGGAYSYIVVDHTEPQLILPASGEERYNPEKPQQDWWSPEYLYRQRFSIVNLNSTTPLPKGYPVLLSIGITELVAQGKALHSGNDIRIVYFDGSAKELKRLVESKPIATYPVPENDNEYNPVGNERIATFESGLTDNYEAASAAPSDKITALKITFYVEVQEPIPPKSAANNYYMYYGNMFATEPPTEIYNHNDEFIPPPIVELGIVTSPEVPAFSNFVTAVFTTITIAYLIKKYRIKTWRQRR